MKAGDVVHLRTLLPGDVYTLPQEPGEMPLELEVVSQHPEKAYVRPVGSTDPVGSSVNLNVAAGTEVEFVRAGVRRRDTETLDAVDRAVEQVDAALKSMPNHVASVFDGDDAGRLYRIRRDLQLLALAREEVPR
jgi:hypothetical protein